MTQWRAVVHWIPIGTGDQGQRTALVSSHALFSLSAPDDVFMDLPSVKEVNEDDDHE